MRHLFFAALILGAFADPARPAGVAASAIAAAMMKSTASPANTAVYPRTGSPKAAIVINAAAIAPRRPTLTCVTVRPFSIGTMAWRVSPASSARHSATS